MSQPIKIDNAVFTDEGGTTTKGTLTGDATLQAPGVPPGTGDEHPAHPILTPPTSDNPDVFFVLCYCPNPPPPHWEWIAFMPGEDVPEKPQPTPPPVDPPIDGIGIVKPPPADGGWGWFPGYGWVWYPGPGGAGPKKR